MSEFEQDLRDMLARRADATTTSPNDWQDLTVRMARQNRRSKRVMAMALAVVLLVGPLAGFAVARVVEDSDPGGQVTAGGPTDSGTGGDIGTTERLARSNAFFDGPVGQNLEKLFRRTSGDGITIRGYINRSGSTGCQGDGWCPPADCYPDATITGELSTDAAVGFANGSHYGATTTDVQITGAGFFGANGEGSPARWTIAQVSDRVAKVRVSYEGGGSDEMDPVDGVVVLAALTDVEKSGGTVEGLDGSGAVVGSADVNAVEVHTGFRIDVQSSATLRSDAGSVSSWSQLSSSSSSSSSSDTGSASTPTTTIVPDSSSATVTGGGPELVMPDPRPDCLAPPPSLPAPGEQPADPAAAKAEVEQAFTTAYAGGLAGEDEAKRAVVEDSEALVGVMDEIRNGAFAQQVKDASAQVTEVVFTSPTEAAVRYDIKVKDYTNFDGRIGRALLIDGRWKVARVTVCADIALAGGGCPAK